MQPPGEEEVLDLRIHGMSCTACATRIERAVGKMAGITGVSVHYAAKSAYITYAAGTVSPAGIIERIGQIGFQAFPYGRDGDGGAEIDALKLRVIAGSLLTLPLLWTMAHHYAVLSGIPVPSFIEEPLLQLLLASIVQFFIGMPFYFGAYYALRERTANMDVLVAIGTTAAYVYSYMAMLTGGALYFETSAVVITAVLIGKLLEATASERVMKEGDGYASLQAKEAIVVRGGQTERVPLDRLRVGDQLLVGRTSMSRPTACRGGRNDAGRVVPDRRERARETGGGRPRVCRNHGAGSAAALAGARNGTEYDAEPDRRRHASGAGDEIVHRAESGPARGRIRSGHDAALARHAAVVAALVQSGRLENRVHPCARRAACGLSVRARPGGADLARAGDGEAGQARDRLEGSERARAAGAA